MKNTVEYEKLQIATRDTEDSKRPTLTYLDWFQQLPEHYSKIAISNSMPEKLSRTCTTVTEALAFAFHWGKSKEGYEFWESVQQHYVWIPTQKIKNKKGKVIKTIPAHFPELPLNTTQV